MLRNLWRTILRASIFQSSPGMLRLAAWLSGDTIDAPALQPGFLCVDPAGGISLHDDLADAPPGGRVVFPVYFVGVRIDIGSGREALYPLTEFLYAEALAQRAHRRWVRRFPGCEVLRSTLTFDPTQPQGRADIERRNRQTVVDTLRGS